MINHQPIDAVLAITYRCNSRCEMCDIWKIENYPEIKPEEFLKLPKSLKYVNISGGEPFLRADLKEIIKNLHQILTSSQMIISTNGFASHLIENQMREILKIVPKIGIAVSLDGLREIHTQIRGVDWAFEKVLETIKRLKKLGMKNLRISFTLIEKNLDYLFGVYKLAKKLRVEFTGTLAQSSEIYFGGKKINPEFKEGEEKIEKEFNLIIDDLLKSSQAKNWLRAYYNWGLKNFILKRERILPSLAGRLHFFMDPRGDIYPSVVDNFLIGNITQVSDFREIWSSHKAFQIRKELEKKFRPSWMVCTARVAMKKHPFKVGLWILKNKLRVLLS